MAKNLFQEALKYSEDQLTQMLALVKLSPQVKDLESALDKARKTMQDLEQRLTHLRGETRVKGKPGPKKKTAAKRGPKPKADKLVKVAKKRKAKRVKSDVSLKDAMLKVFEKAAGEIKVADIIAGLKTAGYTTNATPKNTQIQVYKLLKAMADKVEKVKPGLYRIKSETQPQ